MKVQKTVTVSGLTWSVVSANERGVTHKGRYFFASRCRSSRPWGIRELDVNIVETGSAQILRRFDNGYETDQLSDAVKEICGDTPDFPTLRQCVQCFVIGSDEDTCNMCGFVNLPFVPHPSTDGPIPPRAR